jgi:hypothetical protein
MSTYYSYNSKINVSKPGKDTLVIKKTLDQKALPPDHVLYGFDSYLYYSEKFKPIFAFYKKIFK